MREDAPGVMTEDFAIGERAIDGRAHRAEIALADLRIDRGAGEFAVEQFDARGLRRHHHFLQKLGADLVAKSARAAMDGGDDVVGRKPEDVGDLGIVDFRDRPEFRDSGCPNRACPSRAAGVPWRARIRIRAARPAMLPRFLDAFEVARLAPAALDRPTRAAREHRVHVDRIERDRALCCRRRPGFGDNSDSASALAPAGCRPPSDRSASCARRRRCRSRPRRRTRRRLCRDRRPPRRRSGKP